MLLRRVIEHVQTQNWFAVAIDFLIVVVGVFVGIQVSNWNNERLERLQEKDLLVRLHEDFTASVTGQRRDLDFLEEQLADQALVLESLSACKVTPGDDVAFQRGIVTLGYVNPPRFYRRTVDELAAAGTTGIIRSDLIKQKLAAIIALVEFRTNAYDTTARMLEHQRFRVEDMISFDVSESHASKYLAGYFGIVYSIEDLCRDPAVASAVSAVSLATLDRVLAYRPILENYEAFLPLLEQELRDRWGLDIGGEVTE